MDFAGNMFIENNGEEATLKDLQKKIEETFGVNLYPTLMKLEKQIPLWRCSSFWNF